MKRCFTKIINWFIKWIHKMDIIEKIIFAISGLLGLTIGITLFVSMDKKPATEKDYEPLEKQMIDIQKNQDLLLNTNCNISISDNNITVKFSNNECSVTAKYTKNLELLSVSKTDKYTFWLLAFVISLFMGFGIYATVSFVLTIIISFLQMLCKSIYDEFKSSKKR